MKYIVIQRVTLAFVVGLFSAGCSVGGPTVSVNVKSKNNEPMKILVTEMYGHSESFLSVKEKVDLASLEKDWLDPVTRNTYPSGHYISLTQETADTDDPLKTYNNKIKVSVDEKIETVYCSKNMQYDRPVTSNMYYRYSETICEIDKKLIQAMMETKSSFSVSFSYTDGTTKTVPLDLKVLPDLQQHLAFKISEDY